MDPIDWIDYSNTNWSIGLTFSFRTDMISATGYKSVCAIIVNKYRYKMEDLRWCYRCQLFDRVSFNYDVSRKYASATRDMKIHNLRLKLINTLFVIFYVSISDGFFFFILKSIGTVLFSVFLIQSMYLFVRNKLYYLSDDKCQRYITICLVGC